MFSWDKELNGDDDGNDDTENTDTDAPAVTPTHLTPAQIRNARLDVRVDSRNSKVVESVKINQRESRIEVSFTDEFSGVKETDFEFDVYLTLDGRRQTDYGMTFTGTFGNPVIEVYEGSDYVDISDGSVALAVDSIKELDVDIGNGVIITTRLSKDKRVYGSATHTQDRADDEIMKEYKDIDYAVSLNTVGLNSTANTVTFGHEYTGFYVYDKDLEYLGKAGDKLAYSDKYYLSSKKLEIVEDLEPVDPTAPVEEPTDPVQTPATTTPGRTPPNANNVPGTGC
jgi:hypothetical protein